jgi:hypothetical protein
VGYAAPGTWPHTARDWRGGRVVFPHTTPEGRLVNLYGRAVDTAEQVPKAKRHDHLPGVKGYFNAAALQAGTGPLWVCEGAFDALALLAAGVTRVVAIFVVHGWRWDWVREVPKLIFALDRRCRRAAAVAPARPPGGAAGQASGGAGASGVRGAQRCERSVGGGGAGGGGQTCSRRRGRRGARRASAPARALG